MVLYNCNKVVLDDLEVPLLTIKLKIEKKISLLVQEYNFHIFSNLIHIYICWDVTLTNQWCRIEYIVQNQRNKTNLE